MSASKTPSVDGRAPPVEADDAVDAFLAKLDAAPKPARGGPGRLIFALDATASREPTWDRAMDAQAAMFDAAAALGGLETQLLFYRGFRECKASRWTADAAALRRVMTGVRCLAGRTQIGRVLQHVAKSAKAGRVDAAVFVGDMMEEDVDALGEDAGRLGLLGVPVFIFHEGGDPVAARSFQHIATLTGGAYAPLDDASADKLRALLAGVAAYAAGGRAALEDYARRAPGARLLLPGR
ncbi:MAG: VWA domain-containing protein [Pseudomonadota bacterium]